MTDANVRLDKWLWAARFFKTRALAKKAIEGGKVHYEGARGKSSRAVELGATLTIRQGWDEKTVLVRALSDQRRGAPEAQLLYEETEQSIATRIQITEQRKMQRVPQAYQQNKPTKKQRRQIVQFKSGPDTH